MPWDAPPQRESRKKPTTTLALHRRELVAIVSRMLGSARSDLACLGEDTLGAFAEGQIAPEVHGPIEAHLAECHDCRMVLALAAAVSSGQVASHDEAPGPESRELAPGTRVGRYIVERRVGGGAMGTVYAAEDPDLDRTVAVKVLRAQRLADTARSRVRARLLREAQAMARLSHPEVITVYDVGTFGDQLFVAMEYVEGETLRQWRAARHRNYADVLEVYERAGAGLAAAHDAGLVHRDFKPDNVLVGRDGRVRVTDFGLARSVDRTSDGDTSDDTSGAARAGLATTLTRSGALVGTPAYMAPEQLRGRSADARSDVFSFCVALYEAVYVERPFAGVTVPGLLASIEQGIVRAAPIMTRVPRWLRSVLLVGLRAAPEERFASMRALLDALRSAPRASRRRSQGAMGLGVATIVGLSLLLAMPGTHGARPRGASASAPGDVADVAVRTPSAIDEVAVVPPSLSHEALLMKPPALGKMAVSTPRPHSSVGHAAAGSTQPSPSTAPSAPARVGTNGALILE